MHSRIHQGEKSLIIPSSRIVLDTGIVQKDKILDLPTPQVSSFNIHGPCSWVKIQPVAGQRKEGH